MGAMQELAKERRWRSQIEPNADVIGGDEFVMKVSQAISAKRQADALERIALSLSGAVIPDAILRMEGALINIAWDMGAAFHKGSAGEKRKGEPG